MKMRLVEASHDIGTRLEGCLPGRRSRCQEEARKLVVKASLLLFRLVTGHSPSFSLDDVAAARLRRFFNAPCLSRRYTAAPLRAP